MPITEEKKKDLISLLQFIPEIYHPFYQNLKTNNNLRDPLVSDEEGEYKFSLYSKFSLILFSFYTHSILIVHFNKSLIGILNNIKFIFLK